MIDILKEKIRKSLSYIKIPGLNGFSLLDLLELYFLGLTRGTLTSRAGSVSFSFFMALFPFILFNIENFDAILFNFIETILPQDTHTFFEKIFEDIKSKPRAGLLSSVFLLSVILTANGVNSIFTSFEVSYHVKEFRNIFKQYFYSLGVSFILALLLLASVISFVSFELLFQRILPDSINLAIFLQNLIFVLLAYISITILYYFGTIQGKFTGFFSPGALMTTLLFFFSTYLFGIYIDNFSNYNQLYGSIGALLIFMLFSWINSIILLLGFELNATIRSLNEEKKAE